MKIINKHITNLAQRIGCKQNSGRLHECEENRLKFVLGEKYAAYYGYDGNGERVYKLTGYSGLDQINSGGSSALAVFDDAVLYPNPYMVITPKGYTKHYFAGSERLATVIGGGGFYKMISPIDTLRTHDNYIRANAFPYYERNDPFRYHHTISDPLQTEDISGRPLDELQYHCGKAWLENLTILAQDNIMLDAILSCADEKFPERNKYFYHGDHLGSASWITDSLGVPIQYIHYAPYGELIDNQTAASVGYDERYKFTGKERDEETGYDAFGARYYWTAGTWLSVDPLSSDYPWISPYAYCGWNPIKYVDPDGRFLIEPPIFAVHYTSKDSRTAFYAMLHPQNALAVGEYDPNKNNISTIAGRFTINLMKAAGFYNNDPGAERNAYRHTLWQAIITNAMDEKQARKIGNAHECRSAYDATKLYTSLDEVDTTIDLMNNEIGRSIGAKNKGASNKEMALMVLNEFRDNGLWVGVQQADGLYKVQKKRITQEQYDAALKELNKKGNNGLNKE